MSVYLSFLCMDSRLEVAHGNLFGCIYSRFEIGSPFYKNGRSRMRWMRTSSQLRDDGYTCQQCGTYLCTDTYVVTVLHIHLTEYLGEEFHAMIVVNGHELVILLLAYLMGDMLSIDDSSHLVLAFCTWFHTDIINGHFTSVSSFPEPSLVCIDGFQLLPVNGCTFL